MFREIVGEKFPRKLRPIMSAGLEDTKGVRPLFKAPPAGCFAKKRPDPFSPPIVTPKYP